MEKVLCGEDLPSTDRLNRLRERFSVTPVPLDARSEYNDGIRFRQDDFQLDTLRVWTMAFQPMTFCRTAELIARSDPETYNICLLQQGAMRLTWSRNDATYGPTDLHVHDSSRPFELRTDSVRGLISWTGVEIPKRLLPRPGGRDDRVIGRAISGQKGIGALLAQFLTQLSTDTSKAFPRNKGNRQAELAVAINL